MKLNNKNKKGNCGEKDLNTTPETPNDWSWVWVGKVWLYLGSSNESNNDLMQQ